MRTISARTDAFEVALEQVRAVVPRPELELDEAPAPQRLAPSSLALTVDMADPDGPVASGRFVLLHDPDGVDEWAGTFRAVVFVRAELETDLVDDPLLHDVGWSWVTESLAANDAHAVQVGGTITSTAGRGFGTMSDRPADGFVEIRASWTPSEDPDSGVVLDDMAAHVQAWLDLVSQAAGLPPLPPGVTSVTAARRRGRR